MRSFVPILVLVLSGCSGVALNVHNGTDSAVMIDGLGDALSVEPGVTARVERLRSIPPLTALSDGTTVESVTIAAPPKGGEAVWVVGGGACFAEADYGSYYSSVDVPAGAVLIGSNEPSEHVYVTAGRIQAGPGQMLPRRARGAVHALVQIPCQAGREGDAILRSWLELKLADIQPSQ